jgi:uncharacterized protein YkwD
VTGRSWIAALFLLAGLLVLPSAAQARHGQSHSRAPFEAQERTMRCLVNHARTSRGLQPLKALTSLVKATDRKARDILRCDEFSHEASVAANSPDSRTASTFPPAG